MRATMQLRRSVDMSRVKRVFIHHDEVLMALGAWRRLDSVAIMTEPTELPRDGFVVVGCTQENDFGRAGFWLLVHHPDFPEVPDGHIVPEMDKHPMLELVKVKVELEPQPQVGPRYREIGLDPGAPGGDETVVTVWEKEVKPPTVEEVLKVKDEVRTGRPKTLSPDKAYNLLEDYVAEKLLSTGPVRRVNEVIETMTLGAPTDIKFGGSKVFTPRQEGDPPATPDKPDRVALGVVCRDVTDEKTEFEKAATKLRELSDKATEEYGTFIKKQAAEIERQILGVPALTSHDYLRQVLGYTEKEAAKVLEAAAQAALAGEPGVVTCSDEVKMSRTPGVEAPIDEEAGPHIVGPK